VLHESVTEMVDSTKNCSWYILINSYYLLVLINQSTDPHTIRELKLKLQTTCSFCIFAVIISLCKTIHWMTIKHWLNLECWQPLYCSMCAKEKGSKAHTLPCQVPCFALSSSSLVILSAHSMIELKEWK